MPLRHIDQQNYISQNKIRVQRELKYSLNSYFEMMAQSHHY